MAITSANIDRLRIATPCPISWDDMAGDNRVRFCNQCRLNVYNISALSRIETETLIASTEGRLCARLFRRADGTVLTRDCPIGLRALRCRIARKGAAAFAALVGLSSAVFGQQAASQVPGTENTSSITRDDATSDQATSPFSGTVMDPVSGGIPGARVTVTNTLTKKTVTASTREDGRFSFGLIPIGSYSVRVEAPGFKTLRIKKVAIQPNKVTTVELMLKLSGEIVGIPGSESQLIDTPASITTISGDIIRRLPIQR